MTEPAHSPMPSYTASVHLLVVVTNDATGHVAEMKCDPSWWNNAPQYARVAVFSQLRKDLITDEERLAKLNQAIDELAEDENTEDELAARESAGLETP